MKTFASTHSCTQNNVREHSPIYDLAAYEKRQRKLKRKHIFKNILDTIVFFSACSIVFSLLFWGV
ncbi:hypothetical protein ABEKA_0034 [Acinetobacter lwoffii]|uniref:hypothetical protein n=1 Tax=Acinetobacter lwoffii TaxID=28090 RepID=UPI001E6431D0|nr:hypothetical protein [Acinetobacter lwoffii]QZD32106.1 hypothetical protein ABEKA_0034 [Acinetobacter lwoffii]